MIAATNQERQLDTALLRPGRFDRKVEVCLPNYQERIEILKVHLRSRTNEVSGDTVRRTATLTEGFSGAELENIVNEAAFAAIRRSQENDYRMNVYI